MKKENIEEQSKFEIIEKYVYSNLDDNYSLGLSPEEINNIKMERLSLNNEIESFFKTNEFANVCFLAQKYTSLESSSTTRILLLSKVATLLGSPMIKSSMEDFIKMFSLKYVKKDYNKNQKQYIKDNCSNIFKTFFSQCDTHIAINTLFPNIFEEDEIDEYEIKITECLEKDENISPIIESINEKFKDRVRIEYENMRAYESEIQDRFLVNDIENKNDLSNYDISEEIIEWCESLKYSSYIVNHYREEYESWIGLDDMYKSLLYLSEPKYRFFHIYYHHVDGLYLFYFFDTLNEQRKFNKFQIEYIREMAPKLQISSYMNEEYAKYKKWHNPDARVFDFGKEDEAEKEVEDEDVLLESEQIDEADLKDENIEKLHLKRLSRFTKEQLIELLKKFRDRKEPFVHKKTKQKNWLFVFGMSGDIPPKGFEKIKWEAKYNNRPAKGALIDFLELLGYDIDQLYNVNSIKILNECFECYNKQNEKVPIDQNDFHYIGKTKEREYSKTHYNIFKEIIEGILKQP